MESRGTPRALSPAIAPHRLASEGAAVEPMVTESLAACSASAEPVATGRAPAVARPVAVESLAAGLAITGWATVVAAARAVAAGRMGLPPVTVAVSWPCRGRVLAAPVDSTPRKNT
jgi:hypothetical protein